MSIRVAACLLFVLAFSAYAWRNWFVSLCAGIVLMACLEHPDMPRGIMGIPGMNLWNVLYVNVTLSWLISRRREGLEWDMPRALTIAFALYLCVTVVAFLRLLANPTSYFEGSTSKIIIDYLVNPFKFLLPCFMLYDGCRSRERISMVLASIFLAFMLLSIQGIKCMGFHFDLSGDELSGRAERLLHRSVGFHRCDMSMILAGAGWMVVAYSRWFSKWFLVWGVYASAGIILLAQALTGGRTGYATWGLVGLTLCCLRWRRLLPLIPVGALLVVLLMPGVAQRMLQGFGSKQGDIVVESDANSITSGRSTIWPYVLERIEEKPIFGYGRLAMIRTGLSNRLLDDLGEEFGHPHNAYFEILFDDGIVGLLCIMSLYVIVLKRSLSLFMDRSETIYEVVGGASTSLVLALLLGSLGAQTLYPREGVFWMWATIGVAMRVWVERENGRRITNRDAAEEDREPDLEEEAAYAGQPSC